MAKSDRCSVETVDNGHGNKDLLFDPKIAGENAFSQDENYVFIFCLISNDYAYRK